MRHALVWLVLAFPAFAQEGAYRSFGFLDPATGKAFDRAEIGIGSDALAIGQTKYAWQIDSQIVRDLSDKGIIANGDAYGLIYELNGVQSIDELVGRPQIVTIDPVFPRAGFPAESTGRLVLKQSNPAFDDFTAVIDSLDAAVNEPDWRRPAMADWTAIETSITTSYETYAAFNNAIELDALPLSAEFVEQLDDEATYLEMVTTGFSAGNTSAFDFKVLAQLGEDNDVRSAALQSASGPSGGSLGNGQVAITVSLTDYSELGRPVSGYRVRYAPIYGLDRGHDLSEMTSPARGRVPLATYCYWAFDSATGQRVSDTHVAKAQALWAGQSVIALRYLGAQGPASPDCTIF